MAGAATLAQGRDRRRKIVRFAAKFTKTNGYPPSVEEIALGVDLQSKTAVRHHLAILAENGDITMQKGKYRSIRVVKTTGIA